MKIRKVRLEMDTAEGQFGFHFAFSSALTVVRGNNSSGKSTFFNCLLYSLGMEELVGGRGPKVLPYGVKDYFEYEGRTITVESSRVLVEIQNKAGDVVTVVRTIKDAHKDSKLAEVATGSMEATSVAMTSYFLHDGGAASTQEGFYTFLERFLDLQLPRVPSINGGATKLYLQTAFGAFAVEQKRGWTDYVANIPFFGIRDARLHVVEYVLGLDVFEAGSLRAKLDAEAIAIDRRWNELRSSLVPRANQAGINVEGLPERVKSTFDREEVKLTMVVGESSRSIIHAIAELRSKHEELGSEIEGGAPASGAVLLNAIEAQRNELLALSSAHEAALADLEVARASVSELEAMLREIEEDLARNKAVRKLKQLGAELDLAIASDKCPTCSQSISDSLLPDALVGPQMSLVENIAYLDSQRRMLERQIAGARERVAALTGAVRRLSARVAAKRDELAGMRGDFSTGENQIKTLLRSQLQLEARIKDMYRLLDDADEILAQLGLQAAQLRENQAARQQLPAARYSISDEAKIALFEKDFRANAGEFGYSSAPIKDIEINRASLTPFLAQMELRAIKQDIRADSSASDFVRLIWSYLLALYQANRLTQGGGNHLGVLLFDEPGQHSMSQDSQRALLRRLASTDGLQSIVAASFDESESVFSAATEGVPHLLLSWDGKLIRPLQSDAMAE